MDTVFPFGFPLPTAFYLSWFVITLVVTFVFMHYVLAGTTILAVTSMFGKPKNYQPQAILKDWLPVLLSGAITAGIAPLLFIQILYREEYYTANLLLFHRWMSILPVLIVGFYAMYLMKSSWLEDSAPWMKALITLIPFLCVVYTGYSWTENHLLSLRGLRNWAEFYQSKSQIYFDSQLIPRATIWLLSSFPTLAVVLGWQLRHVQYQHAGRFSFYALISLVILSVTLVVGYLTSEPQVQQALTSSFGLPWVILLGLGLVLQLVGWIWQSKSAMLLPTRLSLITIGLFLTLLGLVTCREMFRVSMLGMDRFASLFPSHAESFSKSGIIFFLGFVLLNAVLVAYCVRLVIKSKMDKLTADNPPSSETDRVS